jgi:ribosomal protein L20A (L18A)
VKNSHAYPGADADTDHNLVMMSAFLTLKNVKRKKIMKRWDRQRLKSRQVEFGEAVDKKLKSATSGSAEQKWQALKNAVLTQAKRVVGYKKGRQLKKPWVTEEMLKKMEERRKVKHQSTEGAKKEYRRLNNELRRATDKAREVWWEEQCKELEELQRQGKYDQVYSRIGNSRRKEGKRAM